MPPSPRRHSPPPTSHSPLALPHHAPDPLRPLANELYRAALRGADAAAAVTAALDREPLPTDGAVWLVAIGKAARAMAESATAALATEGRAPAGGIVVAPETAPAPHPALEAAVGDHPVPGPGSFEAARRLALLTTRVAPADSVLVLLSGGATALVGAPAAEVEAHDLVRLHETLLASGLEIGTMNAFRKRFSRWGAGRLAAALAPARVRCLAVSDVAGDDPAAIGSGPCVPDPLTAAELLALAEGQPLRAILPPALRHHLELVARGAAPETPKPGDPSLARTSTTIVLSNRDALAAAARAAGRAGCDVEVATTELAGDAAAAGRACAERLLEHARARRAAGGAHRPLCLLWGGETTVALPEDARGRGGRCQELALAAAGVLRERGGAWAEDVLLLAAGTDGRDGPTDAAGALVDGRTWDAITRAGLDPSAALARHDSHPALDAAGALVRTGHTGTNVRDVVIGLVAGDAGAWRAPEGNERGARG